MWSTIWCLLWFVQRSAIPWMRLLFSAIHRLVVRHLQALTVEWSPDIISYFQADPTLHYADKFCSDYEVLPGLLFLSLLSFSLLWEQITLVQKRYSSQFPNEWEIWGIILCNNSWSFVCMRVYCSGWNICAVAVAIRCKDWSNALPVAIAHHTTNTMAASECAMKNHC